MLAGRRPFEEESIATLAAKTLYQEPPGAVTFNPSLNPMVDVVLRKALSKTGEKRYPSCGDFAGGLREAASGTKAPPSTAARKWTMAAAASALIVILLAAGWLYNKVHHRRDAAPGAIAQAPSPPPAEQQVAPPPPSKENTSPVAAFL